MEEMLARFAVCRLKKARLEVNVTQLPAIGLYTRFGFHRDQEKFGHHGRGEAVQQMVMERELPVWPCGLGRPKPGRSAQ